MGRITIAVLLAFSWSWVAWGQAVNPPPRPLHKVDDHWTPYDPPKEFPADAEVYIIKQGDTLWALAKQYLNDPYLWPQLWENNKYIRDAHWIYPGDPLVVGVKKTEVGAPTGEGATPVTPTGEGAGAAGAPGAPTGEQPAGVPGEAGGEPTGEAGELVAVGSEDDIYCFAYLDEKNSEPTLTIASAEQVQYQANYSTGDIVFLSGGEAEGVKAGQEYFITLPVRKVRHPHTNAVLGTLIRYLGHLRVLCTQDHSATAEVLASCDAIPLGATLKPYEPIPIPMVVLTAPLTRCDPESTKPRGTVIYTRDDINSFGQDHMVMIDLGDADQVSPGSVCTLFRENPIAGAPRILLGEIAILTSGEHWATGKIVRSTAPMHVGDRVEVK
jgi:hypothetical protein